jgi:site-specific DNA-cytosine methylase
MPDKDNFGALLQVSVTLRAKAAASHRLDTDTYIPVPIQDGREINKQQNGIGVGQPGDPAYTLDTTGAQSVYTKAKRAQSDTDDETWVEGEVNPTLSLFDCGDVRATTIAIQAYSIREDAKANNFSATPTDVGLTVSALVPGVQSHHAQIFLAEAIPLDLRNSQRDPEKHDAQNRQGLGVGSVGDPAPTVDASFVHGVAQTVAPTITATNDPSRSPQSSEVTQQVAAVYASTMTVRRLTPRECERLQGFPDDYTLIPWRKKAAADCPDGPRYKALGNSMAVNCMEWIGERIAAFEAAE